MYKIGSVYRAGIDAWLAARHHSEAPMTSLLCPKCKAESKPEMKKSLLDVVLKILPRLGERERQAVMEAINANEAR